MDGLIGQGGGEILEQVAAGDVMDAQFQTASGQANALNQPAFPQAALTDKNDVLLTANEVALGQSLDLQAWDGRVETPVERVQGERLAEVGVLDEAFDAALAAQAGLVGEQPMEEVQVGQAGVLGLLQDGVELVGSHGDTQGGEVGEDLVTQDRSRLSSSACSGGFSGDGVSSVESSA